MLRCQNVSAEIVCLETHTSREKFAGFENLLKIKFWENILTMA